MRRYLVTGGAGFIGSHLVEALLAQGCHLRVLDDLSTGKLSNLPEAVEFMEGCITDLSMVSRAMHGVEGVFHLAAVASVQRSMQQWAQTHRVNLAGSVNIFEQAAKAKVPVVYASSAAVYGDNQNLPLSEDTPPQPITPYGLDKLGCEQQAAMGARSFGLRSVGLRFFNVYGPRQDPHSPYSGVISIFVNRLKQHQALTVFGDGEQSRDFIYVGDVVELMLSAMGRVGAETSLCAVSNACTGQSVSVKALAETLAKIGDTPLQLNHQPERIGDIRHSCGDPVQMQQAFGLDSLTDLTEGLEQLWHSS